MKGEGEAWVWSQYSGVLDEQGESPGPLPLFGGVEGAASSRRVRWGFAFTLAMGLGLFFPKIAFLLLVVAAMMVASGLAPERFEAFCNGVPGGNLVLSLLSTIDALLP